MDKKGLIEKLVTEKLIDENKKGEILEKSNITGKTVLRVILEEKILSEDEILTFLMKVTRYPKIDISTYEVDQNILKIVDREICVKYLVFPLFKSDNSIFVSFFDPFDIEGYETLKKITKSDIEVCISKASEIINGINIYYKLTEDIEKAITEATTTYTEIPPFSTEETLTEIDAPIIKTVDLIIQQAISDRATDIHIDPEDEYVSIKFRVDGFLVNFQTLFKNLQEPIVSRIKILSKMDISEKRLPQDGHITYNLNGKIYNLRVATYPTVKGEKIVIRVLPEIILYHLDSLGLKYEELGKIRYLIRKNSGLLLVTGPTGSGKTTTLYALLEEISKTNKNILTIEEPVEIRLRDINQSETLSEKNWTFETALRSILRLDPDVIMVGEIRDLSSAKISIQAALTGHLVLSTLHTNDAPGSIVRLIDMGIESYLISSSLIGVINQRLVRLLCPYCKVRYTPDEKVIDALDIERREYEKGTGCKNCFYTGYLGRVGIYEILVLNEDIFREIFKEPNPENIKKVVKKYGMQDLISSGKYLLEENKTNPEELLRVVGGEYAL